MTNEYLRLLKMLIKPGTVLKLIKMNDNNTEKYAVKPNVIEPGSIGIVKHIDDIGQIHMFWDNGSTLALIPEVDEFEIFVIFKE